MKAILLSAALFLLLDGSAFSQKFWLTTYEFPGGPKTGIAAIGDTCLIAGLTDGVLRSFNEGQNWNKVLESTSVYTVHATPEGVVLAGGRGRIFVSGDYGSSWDSVTLGHQYPVAEFVHQADGSLFAITGLSDTVLGYVGAGVYYSADNGVTWTQRNNGLNNYLYCDQIAADAYGRLYVTVRDEVSEGPGGLYFSDDKGLHWQHVDIRFDGDGVVENEAFVEFTRGLSVSPMDSIYVSLEGTAGSALIRLNLSKHRNDLTSNGFWTITKVGNSVSWWTDRTLNDIHFAQNGDVYSSVSGTYLSGGTYFKKNGAGAWNRQLQGLGYDLAGLYNAQTFAEKSSGKIFMVQYLDERIYWADTSQTTALHDMPFDLQNHLSVYPNPSAAGENIRLVFDSDPGQGVIYLLDLFGRVISVTSFTDRQVDIETPNEPGTYLLRVGNQAVRVICQ